MVAILFLAIVIPTNEFRARIWFLLAGLRDYTLHITIFAAFALAGFVILALLRSWQLPSILGALIGAALQLALISAGGYRWVPEFPTLPSRVAACAVTLALAIAILWRKRRGSDDAPAPDSVGATLPPGVDGGFHTPPTVPWQRDHDRTA